MVADTAIFGPLHVAGYFTHMVLSEGGTLGDVRRKLARDFWPTFSAELTVWPVVQTANFKLVPLQYQLLVVNLCTILGVWVGGGEVGDCRWGQQGRRGADARFCSDTHHSTVSAPLPCTCR